jgi:hypothetical protein
MTWSLALFVVRCAVTFLEIVSAKELKAGGSDNREHLDGTGSGWSDFLWLASSSLKGRLASSSASIPLVAAAVAEVLASVVACSTMVRVLEGGLGWWHFVDSEISLVAG